MFMRLQYILSSLQCLDRHWPIYTQCEVGKSTLSVMPVLFNLNVSANQFSAADDNIWLTTYKKKKKC